MKQTEKQLQGLPTGYLRLQARLAQSGWVALGSLIERTKPGQGGPRYQWSRRVEGKTITVALSAEQFQWLKKAIANQRKVWKLLDQMQKRTLQYLWKNLPDPRRRKSLSKKTLGLTKGHSGQVSKINFVVFL